MIKTQDLKLQMDELTKQNDMVLIELEQVKKMLINGSQNSQGTQSQQPSASDGQQDQDQTQGQRQGQGQGQGQDQQSASQGQEQNSNQDSNQSQPQGQSQSGQSQGQGQSAQSQSQGQSGQGQDQSQSQGQANGSNSQQVTDLANELLKIKDLVEKLEQKTSQYVSSQSNGTLTEKDAVNLILTLMNGMVDWASEFVSSKASSNGQLQ
ncbi:hypothetical protein GCM10008018_00830 [Paenibacillus marchantiophytorum]|uniref:Spore coat protein n=1 Tax=Paenibacillus marchantiophytorum TaxID=1619310 RepID=A0ABQ2BMJ2_9BACL|nr:hypothetical protein [Paenibacillus marchantiophytorum]GGI43193.1 hypothetical protein GCM10008018_00830 [Paenibacillus marchantiophytorum]